MIPAAVLVVDAAGDHCQLHTPVRELQNVLIMMMKAYKIYTALLKAIIPINLKINKTL